jgi:hypothetical protein
MPEEPVEPEAPKSELDDFVMGGSGTFEQPQKNET